MAQSSWSVVLLPPNTTRPPIDGDYVLTNGACHFAVANVTTIPIVDTRTTSLDVTSVVRALYVALLGREADDSGCAGYIAHLSGGGALEDVIRHMLRSVECQVTFFGNRTFQELIAPSPLPAELPRLYIWHVPKTGGTSLREMVMAHFPVQQQCCGLTLSELCRLSPARLRSFRVISGHFGPLLPRLLSDVPLVTATLLRDPALVVPSIYRQLSRHGTKNGPYDLARGMAFDVWCRHEETRGLWSNPQARALALERHAPSWPGPNESPEGETVEEPEEDELEVRAVEVLEKIDVVGTIYHITDVYRESLRRIGIEPFYSEALHLNSSEQFELSKATLDWLRQHNQIDMRLFRVAERRGEEIRRRA